MEGGAIARFRCIFHPCNDMNIRIVSSTTLYTEEDPHQDRNVCIYVNSVLNVYLTIWYNVLIAVTTA